MRTGRVCQVRTKNTQGTQYLVHLTITPLTGELKTTQTTLEARQFPVVRAATIRIMGCCKLASRASEFPLSAKASYLSWVSSFKTRLGSPPSAVTISLCSSRNKIGEN